MLSFCQSFLRLPVAWLVRENLLLLHFSKDENVPVVSV